jgi:uncharacterized membrane protein
MTSPSSSGPRSGSRVGFVDLLRGWAVIIMIQTHVFNALLLPALTAAGLYAVIRFVDGLVAPSFLFASGLAYAITTRRKLPEYLAFGWPLFRQLGRLLLILLIGYLLHIPRFNYYHLVHEVGPDAWEKFWQADVLHCIAVSLLFLQVLLLVLRSERRLYRAVLAVTAGVIMLTPVMWTVNWWNYLPLPIASYLNGMYSLFPLFPWSAFLFAGALTGHYYAEARSGSAPGGEKRMMRRASAIGLGMILLSFPLHPVAEALYPVYDYWHVSPSFVLLRLGLVFLLCGGLFLYEGRQGVHASSVVTLFGRESLIVYVTHLTLLYGNFFGDSLVQRLGGSFTYPRAIGATLLLILLMYLMAFVWGRIKRGPVKLKLAVEAAFVAIILFFFFFGPRLQAGGGRTAPRPDHAPASFPPDGGITMLRGNHEGTAHVRLCDDHSLL